MIPASTDCAETAPAKKRAAFVDAAREAFFTHGYSATTMSSIATTVGGSKTTLWTYFPSKEELFAAVVDDIAEHYAQALTVELPEDEDIVPVLTRYAKALMATLLSEPIRALNRIVLSEATRFPHLAEMMYARGPKKGKARFAEYIGRAMDRGVLRKGDPLRASYQFAGLLQSGCYQAAVLNLDPRPSAATVDADIEAAVDTFYRAWQPEG